MRLKTLFAAVLGASLLLTAGGCSISDLSKDDMLRPPKTMGDEAEIEQLIASAAQSGYTLKYPKSGNYRSAVVMRDLDGDGVNEAIAFFRDKEGSTGVHMLVMYERDGKWHASNDFITETTDVDCVDFADIDIGGTQEILVGYSTYTAGVNFLSVYTYDNGVTETIESGQNYSSFFCGDMDDSGKSKVVTLSLFNAENEAKATMLEYDSQRRALFAQASAAMDGNVASYKNVVFSDLGNGVRGLLVDGVLTGGEMVTQVIYYSRPENVLRNPLYRERSANPTQRPGEVLCTDNDSDGRYEIPAVYALPSSKAGDTTAADLVVWNIFNLETEDLQPVRRTVTNPAYSYAVSVPDTWQEGSYSALLEQDNTLLSFCEWNGDSPGVKLFDVRVFKASDWEQGADSTASYSLLFKDSRYAYAFINYKPGGGMAMDDKEIKNAFARLSKSAGNNKTNQ